MGFDQMTPVYKSWLVLGSKITLTWNYKDSSLYTKNPLTVMLACVDPGFVFTDAVSIKENRDKHWTWTTWMDTANSNVPSTRRLTNWFSARKFWDVRDVSDDIVYRGNATTDPAVQAYYEIFFMENEGNLKTSSPYYFTVNIDYIVEWSGKALTTGS